MTRYHLAFGHPLRGVYVLKPRDHIAVPRNGGRRPPKPPFQLGDREGVTRQWREQQAKFASFVVANFVPWPTASSDSKPPGFLVLPDPEAPDLGPPDPADPNHVCWPPPAGAAPTGPPNQDPETLSMYIQVLQKAVRDG